MRSYIVGDVAVSAEPGTNEVSVNLGVMLNLNIEGVAIRWSPVALGVAGDDYTFELFCFPKLTRGGR